MIPPLSNYIKRPLDLQHEGRMSALEAADQRTESTDRVQAEKLASIEQAISSIRNDIAALKNKDEAIDRTNLVQEGSISNLQSQINSFVMIID